MIRIVGRLAAHVGWALLYGGVGGFLVIVVVLVMHLNGRPDLKVWHKAKLKAEFTADSGLETFAEYLALEDRLFEQLDEEVYAKVEPEDRSPINRYSRGSRSDPDRWPRNWNRSFELPVENARVGVLLIHGMSDSPYSMRSLAENIHARGAWVLGMRMPGHGTAPSGLVRVEWQDMAAAVRLAMKHLRERLGDAPLCIVGYSNGGALAVDYSLGALEDAELPRAERLVLLSPEIGITRFAALSAWQARLGRVLGLQKLAWNSIQPEYDSYKYGSFAINAGEQAYLITQDIQKRLARVAAAGELGRFPPTLAFQSVVDATVTAPALVSGFFAQLPQRGHELVLFDINRYTNIEAILTRDPNAWLHDILGDSTHAFTVTALMNASEETREVVARRREPGKQEVSETALGLSWPPEIYSLAHVSLPFPPDDPLYGGMDPRKSPWLPLGSLALRGERGVLEIRAAEMLRLRWNPFHAYIEQRTLEALDLLDAEAATPPARARR